MADFKKMIPFILHCEEGIPVGKLSLPPEEIFGIAAKKGVHVDPNDSGGPTLCGVILATYADYRRKHGFANTTIADLNKMSFAEWLDILKSIFWDRWKADEIKSEMIAIACVDWLWGSGVIGIKKVQRLLGVPIDGVVGPITLSALNTCHDQRGLFEKIQSARHDFHCTIAPKGSKNHKFLRGWNRRVAMITWSGFNYQVK